MKTKVFETRITKIEKGVFFIEYKTGRWTEWVTHPKKFKSITSAEEYVATHFTAD